MNVLDLFSGIGGFSLGLERAGMRTVAFCEIDPYARAVLDRHWPGIACAPDITAREFSRGEADVICGGFPCQDISLAGDGAGLAGERSGLWRELLRAIRVVRPRYAIVENVAALLSRGLDRVLGDMAEIGYDAEWHCIPASAAGAPHRRDRVWIIANPGSEQHEGCSPPLSGAIAEELSRAAANAYGELIREQQVSQRWSEAQAFASTDREMAYAEGDGWFARRAGDTPQVQERRQPDRSRVGSDVANTNDQRELQSEGSECDQRRRPSDGRWWLVEPDVGRVANGIPSRVDRLKGLGNAVVPQIPEIIGRAIMRAANE